MRVGIVSDIHCNYEGLTVALERMGPVDELLCAGDMVYQYRFNNEVIELLREHGAKVVLGNHDMVVLGPQGAKIREAPTVRQDNIQWMYNQPAHMDVTIDGKRFVMTHGSPLEPFDRYVFPNTPDFKELERIDYADFIVLGHTHLQIAERVGRALVINPGSTGETRDYGNGRVLSYCILDTKDDVVTFDTFVNPVGLAKPATP